MDHETASLLLSDWVARKLAVEPAAEVREHVEGCAECGALAETLVAVRGEVAEHGHALWSPHPGSLDLARFVSGDEGLSTDELARIGSHVRACPTCATESRLAGEARRHSALRWIQAWLPEWRDRRSLVGAAWAAVAVVLAYPAFLGVVEYPRELRRHLQLEHRTESSAPARTPIVAGSRAAAPAETGGPAAVLILSGESRGASNAIPVARLRAGQTMLPLLIDAARPTRDPVEIELMDRSGSVRWRAQARGADLWDEQQHVLSLTLPVTALSGGEFVLSLGSAGHPLEVTRRFRVIAAPPAE